jgi:Protein of unknown function (DUF2817)
LTQRRSHREMALLLNETEIADEECITWIDVHTGLGPMGIDTLLFGSSMDPPDPLDIQRWFPNSLVSTASTAKGMNNSDTTTKETDVADAVSQGYEFVVGLTIDYYYTTLLKKNSTKVLNSAKHLFMVQEFGTLPSIITGHALIVEHVAHNFYRCMDTTMSVQDLQRVTNQHSKATLGAAFYPQNTLWRINVLQRGLDCLQQAILRSSQYSRRNIGLHADDSVPQGRSSKSHVTNDDEGDNGKDEL